jgi:hypothetical protein
MDPARERELRHPGFHYLNPAADRLGPRRESFHAAVKQGIGEGRIRTRDDIVALAEELGFVVRRVDRDSITLVPPDCPQDAFRMRGRVGGPPPLAAASGAPPDLESVQLWAQQPDAIRGSKRLAQEVANLSAQGAWTGQMEFLVEQVAAMPAGIDVIGRCGDYTIRLGDVFEEAYRLTVTRTPDGFGPTIHDGDRQVGLRVERIEAYHKSLDELGRGMRGRLRLVGTGGEKVKDRDVLGRPLDEVTERKRRL